MSKKKWFKITVKESKDRVGSLLFTNAGTESLDIKIRVCKKKKDREKNLKKNLYIYIKLDPNEILECPNLYLVKGEVVWMQVRKDAVSNIKFRSHMIKND